MSNRLSHNPNKLSSPFKKTVAAVMAATALGSGVAACSQIDRVAPGSIVCSGTQEVDIRPGDTFNGLIEGNVETKGTVDTPEEYQRLFSGIAMQNIEIKAGRAEAGGTFVIDGNYDVTGPQLTAGKTINLPKHCTVVGDAENK